MYLDHRVTVKIARILNMIDLSALLLDNTGSVILPEGDPRVLNLPEAIRTNPTMPLVYGGFTLIGTSEDQPVFICLTGDSEDVKKCAVLCAELINMMLREDMSQTNREQSLRMMLRGEVETSEFETLAAEHGIPMQANRCVLYFYFQDLEAEAALQMMNDGLDSEEDMLTEVGRHLDRAAEGHASGRDLRGAAGVGPRHRGHLPDRDRQERAGGHLRAAGGSDQHPRGL